MLKWECYALCDIGRVRQTNQDNLLVDGKIKQDTSTKTVEYRLKRQHQSTTIAVCDGMGGEQCGEWASLVAVQQLQSAPIHSADDILRCLDQANQIICARMQQEQIKRIGSTAVALHLTPSGIDLVNIGDSRAYRYRQGTLQQMSVDHTELQSKLNAGIPREQIKNPSAGSRLTQHLGIFPHEMLIEPDVKTNISLQKDDIWLLCSDGLDGFVPDQGIANIMASYRSIRKIGRELFTQACTAGGKDNISIVLVKINHE